VKDMLFEMYVVINKHMTDNRFFVVCDGHPVSKQKTVFVEISDAMLLFGV